MTSALSKKLYGNGIRTYEELIKVCESNEKNFFWYKCINNSLIRIGVYESLRKELIKNNFFLMYFLGMN